MIVYSLPFMIDSITYGTFLFFAACTVCAFIFAYLWIPETKGVPIEDMDLLFGKGVSIFAYKAHRNYNEHRQERQVEIAQIFEKGDKEEARAELVEKV